MGRRWRFLLFSVPLVVFLDQASKWLVNQTIPLGGSIPVLDGLFNLVNIRNRGAAFGFLNSAETDWQFWLFLAAECAAAPVPQTFQHFTEIQVAIPCAHGNPAAGGRCRESRSRCFRLWRSRLRSRSRSDDLLRRCRRSLGRYRSRSRR